MVSGLYTLYGKIRKKLNLKNKRLMHRTPDKTRVLQRKDIMKGLIFELTKQTTIIPRTISVEV